MKLLKTKEDLNLYGDKCNFYINTDTRTVVCATTYKNERLRGVAKCDPEDDFDTEIGKLLAYIRCRQKLAKRKLAHAKKVYLRSLEDERKAKKNVAKAASFYRDSVEYLKASNEALEKMMERLGE